MDTLVSMLLNFYYVTDTKDLQAGVFVPSEALHVSLIFESFLSGAPESDPVNRFWSQFVPSFGKLECFK
jgi:hypothetical protein